MCVCVTQLLSMFVTCIVCILIIMRLCIMDRDNKAQTYDKELNRPLVILKNVAMSPIWGSTLWLSVATWLGLAGFKGRSHVSCSERIQNLIKIVRDRG
jgi:hypothetical protein